MQHYRYPINALLADYVRAVIGLTVFGGPALFVPLSSVMVALLGGLGLLFAAYGLRTLVRHLSTLVIDDEGIGIAGPFGSRLAWDDVDEVRIKYFSTWRDRTSGWMQLGVKGKGRTIRLDQAIDSFQTIAQMALFNAAANGATFDQNTRRNAGHLGLDLPPEEGDRAE